MTEDLILHNEKNERLLHVIVYVAIALSMCGVFLADIYTPLGIAVWVFYIVPLSLSLWTRKPSNPLMIAAGSTIFMIANFFTDEAGMSREIAEMNRAIGIVTIWAIAFVGYFFILNKNLVRREEWLQRGQTDLGNVMSGEQRLEELAANILAFLTEFLSADAGAFYALDGERYKKAATLGAAAQSVPDNIKSGEGLIGQAVKDKKPKILTDVPDGYISIGSALGQSAPRHLAIFPAASDNKLVNAVLELGFMNAPNEGALEFLDRISESIGIAVRSAEYRANLQNLLEETQAQAEELQAQGEELRVSNEELEEQSRMLQESQHRLEQQQAELEQTNAQLEEQTQLLEAQKEDLEDAQEDLRERTVELEQSSQYKSDFLANMSHELRTPLNSSLILAKLLADNPDGNLTDEQVRHAETIQAAGNDLLNLINDILDLSKIEAGHMEIMPERVRLNKFIDGLMRIFDPIAKQKGLTLRADIAPDCPKDFISDEKRLEQVIKNLLSNALKFTEKGEVVLRVHTDEAGHLAFAVTDSGIGIAPAQQEIIFEAFRQADGTTNRKYGGTGLGLSISRELSRLLNGDIALQSALGEGSTFTVRIPKDFAQPVSAAPQVSNKPQYKAPLPAKDTARTSAKTKTKKVTEAYDEQDDDRDNLQPGKRLLLVVEDDKSFARILYDMAHDQNFQCIIAHNADEALEAAQDYLPSAVLLDVGLPDHSGLSVLDRLKQDARTRHIPVHVISADDHAQTAYSLGAIGYLLKPVKRDEILNTLKQLEERFVQRMRRVLIVEDDKVQRESLDKLLSSHDVETVGVGTAADCLKLLKDEAFDCMVLDLSLPDATGYSLLESLSKEEDCSFPPVIVYTGKDLTSKEEQQLRRYSRSIIIKGAKSPERLLDEVTLFLHQVVSELPPEQQKMLKKAKNRDAILEGRRILVVEDDIRNVYSLSNILEPRGAIVHIARNGKEALTMLEQNQNDKAKAIDLVLMDVMMPEMDGITATRHIRTRKEWKKLPVIMLTAKAMADDQQRCLEAGANDYMAKPLDVEKLLSLVRVWMPR